jgi:hypothetical protein
MLDQMLQDPDLVFFASRAAVLVIALFGFSITIAFWRRAGRRDMESLMNQLDASRSETRSLAELASEMAASIAALRERLDERMQLAQVNAPGAGGIDLAVRLARQGSSLEEIVKTCGVTRQEAQLLLRLHVAEAHRQA